LVVSEVISDGGEINKNILDFEGGTCPGFLMFEINGLFGDVEKRVSVNKNVVGFDVVTNDKIGFYKAVKNGTKRIHDVRLLNKIFLLHIIFFNFRLKDLGVDSMKIVMAEEKYNTETVYNWYTPSVKIRYLSEEQINECLEFYKYSPDIFRFVDRLYVVVYEIPTNIEIIAFQMLLELSFEISNLVNDTMKWCPNEKFLGELEGILVDMSCGFTHGNLTKLHQVLIYIKKQQFI
jgi:hypothetical protein